MSKTPSPFAGIKLTEQPPPTPGPDQRLFTPQPAKSVTTQATKQASLQARKVGTLEPRNLETLDTHKPEAAGEKPLFDLAEQPYRNDTFSFTDGELEAIEDIKIDLRRKHDIRATKNNLIRCAVHLLVEDYKRNKEKSIAARRLKGDSA